MRVRISICCLIILNICNCYAQELSIPIKVSCGSDSQILYIGLDPKASDGIDTSLGESPLPPPPPKGGFDARINLPSPYLDSSIKDFRYGSTKLFKAKISYEIQFQTGNGTTVDISWILPSGLTGIIQDKFEGLVIKKTMNGVGSLTITNSAINKLDVIFDYNFKSTSIEDASNNPEYLPSALNLSQNYPNPFNPSTTISYKVQTTSKVILKVYDVLGREVATLVNETKAPGNYNTIFNVSHLERSREMPSGIYFYKINVGSYTAVRKMLLIK